MQLPIIDFGQPCARCVFKMMHESSEQKTYRDEKFVDGWLQSKELSQKLLQVAIVDDPIVHRFCHLYGQTNVAAIAVALTVVLGGVMRDRGL